MTTKTKEVPQGKSATPTKSAENKEVKVIAKDASAITQEADMIVESAKVIPLVRVEDRFSKLEEFQALQRKHGAIKGKFQSLMVFRVFIKNKLKII